MNPYTCPQCRCHRLALLLPGVDIPDTGWAWVDGHRLMSLPGHRGQWECPDCGWILTGIMRVLDICESCRDDRQRLVHHYEFVPDLPLTLTDDNELWGL